MRLFLIPVKNISKSLFEVKLPRPIHSPSLSPVVIISFVSLKFNHKFNMYKDQNIILRPFFYSALKQLNDERKLLPAF